MEFKLEEPPSPDFGDLSTTLCFQVSKATGTPPMELAQKIASSIKIGDSLVESIEVGGSGYLNFRLDHKRVNELTLTSIRALGCDYGFPKTNKPERILVEHTSVNPIHPVHIGQARNTVLGDAVARMLRARGHNVDVHFYVNDAGRQSAILAYGYRKLGQPKPDIKQDIFLGQIYSITSCLVEIQALKRRIGEIEGEAITPEQRELQEKLHEWVSAAWELQERYPKLFSVLQRETSQENDIEDQVNALLKEYEAESEATKQLFRHVSNLCIEGFKRTFLRFGVHFDFWDWESDLIWSSRVSETLSRLRQTPYVTVQNGVLRLQSGKAVQELGIRSLLGIGEGYDLPSVALTRSDGTTLYLARDISYSLKKFEGHSAVINVVGAEQAHEQLHVRVALAVLGLKELAGRQRHFTFGLVRFPGEKMSSRKGRVITLDEVMDEAVRRAQLEIERRTPDLDEKQKRRMAETIGIGAVKYALLAVEPSHEVDFSWERVLDLEANSAPFINYGYTRAKSILGRLGKIPSHVDYGRLNHPLEKRLILRMAAFPNIFVDATDRLRPDDLAGYANQLTEQFHEYYEHVDVTHLEDLELKNARGALVEAVQTVLRNCMAVLGIELSERM
ncbi:arginine--tRNA ligase [Candidatus Bathyarchaeota archaeon]|nr:arginine--tRNA ligase [Candidatus Bathyarchaeota archaeon]